jgi:hypothetical protein
MKKFLLVGAVLMVGASIYGFVDYSKTKRNKEFSKMYDEPVTKNAEDIKTNDEPVISENETAFIDKTVSEKKEAVKNSNVSKPAFVKKPVKIKIQKPRKISYKSFSRAPLREEVVIVKDDTKTEPRKVVVKEQH